MGLGRTLEHVKLFIRFGLKAPLIPNPHEDIWEVVTQVPKPTEPTSRCFGPSSHS